MSAKSMFEELGYTYKYVNGNNCEDVIIYTQDKAVIQFNLLSKVVVYQAKNNWKDYDKIAIFITKELVQAVNQQINELGWY